MIWGLSGLSTGHLRLQSAVGASSGQVKKFPAPSQFFNRRSIDIDQASAGGLPTRCTSKPAVESTDHRAMSFEIGRWTPDDLQIAGRFQRVGRLQRSSPDTSPTSSWCPANLYMTVCRLMLLHIRLASFSYLWRVTRSKVARSWLSIRVKLIWQDRPGTPPICDLGLKVSLK